MGVKKLRRNYVIWISSGSNHTSFIDEDHWVFMMGSNLHEKLGLDQVNPNNKAKPTILPLA